MNEGEKQNRNAVFVNYHRTFLNKFLNPVALLDYMPCLDNEVKSRIIEAIDFPHRQVEILLGELENSTDSKILGSFLDSINSSPDHQWLAPIFDENTSERKIDEIFEHATEVEKVSKLWNLLRPQLQNIRADHCVTILSPWLAQHEKENLIQKYEKYGNTCTLWWLFEVLMRKDKAWIKEFYDFVKDQNYASSTTYGPLASVILDFFDFETEASFRFEVSERHQEKYFQSPSSDSLLGGHEENVGQNDIVLNVEGSAEQPQNTGLKSEMRNNVTIPNDSKSSNGETASNYENPFNGMHRESEVILNPVDESVRDAASYVFPSLRNYQKELSELAVNGKNVIISAPPGAGKTRVAAYIINNYLETRGNLQKFVLFFTPGAALAQQQQVRLEKMLPNEFTVALCHGNTEESSLELYYNAHIVVLTPQILLNTLMNKVEENPIQNIGQFGLLIFDECHHCMKGHAYNGVMNEYFKLKRHLLPDQILPQVIGLTATIGIGKRPKDAKTEVLRLCANLDAQDGIVTVRNPDNLTELDYYIPQPKQETLGIPKRENNQFYTKLVQMMDEIMKIIQEYPALDQLDSPPEYGDFDDNLDQLIHWIKIVKKEVSMNDVMEQRDIISCVEYLAFCGSAKDMFIKCRPVDAVKQLERYKDLKQPEKFTEVEIKLFVMFQSEIPEFERLAKDKSCANPCLERIKRVLLDKFQREPDSTGIFMVQKQIYTQAIKDWIKEDENLKFLNAEIFTGTSGGNDPMATGMSHSHQRAIMQAFEKGKHKMLISTPEASGEGIDIANCNIIIEYDFLKTEVSTTQIKGRVRKDKGEVFHVSSHKVAKRDELNLQKTLLMNKTITFVQKLFDEYPSHYLKRLVVLQEETMHFHQNAMLAKLALRPRDSGKEYLMQCRKCSADVCSSLDVRVVDGGQHTIPTPGFQEKYTLTPHPRKEAMGSHWEKLNKVLCKQCSNDWGIEAIWASCLTLPLVKIEGFRVKSMDGKIFLPKKWKKSPFAPIKSSLEDLLLQMPQDYDSETENDA